MKQFLYNILTKIRDAWSIIGVTILLLICIEMLSSLIVMTVIPNANVGYDARINADTYKENDKLWLKDYYKEFLKQDVLWEPYVYWHYAPFKGCYINIDEKGLRKTWNKDNSESDISRSKRIFVFGGSTTWGTGARDNFTIPSFISRILNLEKGLNVDVVNFGQSGYVTTQEVILLLKLLQNGQIPDLVIFYDGVSDSFSALQNHEAGIPQNEFNRYSEFNSGKSLLLSIRNLITNSATVTGTKGLMNRLKRKRIIGKNTNLSNNNNNASGSNEQLYEKIIGIYRINMRYVEHLSKAFKFKTLFYWQPSVFTKDSKTGYEKAKELERFEERDAILRINQIVDKITYPNFTNLSNIFKNCKEPLYVDEFHLGERGDEYIARRMAEDIVKILE